jgi:hypothetical protein
MIFLKLSQIGTLKRINIFNKNFFIFYELLNGFQITYFHSDSIRSNAQKGIVATNIKSAIARLVT